MAFSDWSTVDADNSTSSGINIAENCPAANMNNFGRRIMAQLRAAFNPVLDTFFASTTLAQARTALGVGEGNASATAFDGLTNTANSVPYMTGSDAWALATLTSFGRTLIDDGDAATARTTLGLSTVAGITITGSASSGTATLTSGGSTVFMLQWVDGTAAANSTSTINYPTAFSSWSRAWLSGGVSDLAANENNPFVSSSSTTGASVFSGRNESNSVTVFAWGV